jgi:dynactin complex subunit
MEYIEKIKKMLCRELEKFSMKTDLNVTDLEKIHKLSDTIKNLDKIKMLEEDGEGYSEARMGRGGSRYSYDDEMMYSERRGRGRNAKRDSMGRYSSEGGYAEDYRGGMYSYDDAKDHMMNKLGEMMTSANEDEREVLKDCMRKLERI